MTTASEPSSTTEILEIYKLAVETADRVSFRRGTANAFFLSVQSGLVTVLGLSLPTRSHFPWWASLAVVIAGVTLSVAWWLQLFSYRDLNAAKFKVIKRLEEQLPAKFFTEESLALDDGPKPRWRRRFTEIGASERLVPLLFALAHLILFVGASTA